MLSPDGVSVTVVVPRISSIGQAAVQACNVDSQQKPRQELWPTIAK
jgi:hypothetical protein